MDLIVGGAYQGKLDYAKEHFSLTAEDVFICGEDGVLDLSCRCIAGLERFTLACARQAVCATHRLEELGALGPDRIFLCADISCGVVPTDPVLRLWREENGRLTAYLARRAAGVTRVFCGLAQEIKR